MSLAVMIVGGEPSLINHTYQKKLNAIGIVVKWHADRVRHIDSLPTDCEGVIIIKDMCTHGLRDSAVALAKAKGVPFANVLRKFSKAEPILRSVGLSSPANRGTRNTPIKDRIEVATHYIERERRRGRVPKKDEVESAVQRAYGPRMRLTKTQYKRAASLAAQVAPFPAVTKDVMKKKEDKISVEDWCELIFEDDPSLVLSPARTVAKIEDLFSGDRSHLPTSKHLFSMAEERAEERREEWARISSYRGRSNPEKAAAKENLVALKRRWLELLFERGKAMGTTPSSREIKESSKEIFGSTVVWDFVVEARAKITGVPPRQPKTKKGQKKIMGTKNLIKTPQAYAYYRSLCDVANIPPVGEKRFRKLLGTVIEATRIDGRDDHFAPWLTTRAAVKKAFDTANGNFTSLFRGGELVSETSTPRIIPEQPEAPVVKVRKSPVQEKTNAREDISALLHMMESNASASTSAINKLTETLTSFMEKMDTRMLSVEKDMRMARSEVAELADNLNNVVVRLSSIRPERKVINLTDLLESGVEVSLSTKASEG